MVSSNAMIRFVFDAIEDAVTHVNTKPLTEPASTDSVNSILPD